ncbi:MAG: RNA polymerase sigma factor [Actinomycetia bacterium]|nr:RNA polymerase sigma factor [Actinomycetes bacterium]
MNERVDDAGRDLGAFEAFYRATVHDVERFIARRVTDPHVVADLTAECYLVMIEKTTAYRADRGSPRAWAFGIARHVVQDHHRRQARRLHAVARISGRALLDAQSEDDLVARIDAEREARRLLRGVDQLPPAEKAVFELVVVDGLAVDEAAQALGLRPGTARVRLHRARRRLAVSDQEVSPCPSR